MAALLATACGRQEAARSDGIESAATRAVAATPAGGADPRVAGVMIGRRLGAGNRVIEPTFEFAPRDTVFVSVSAAGTGTLTAAWRAQGGQVLQQASAPVAAGENTAFSLAEARGLKPGTYKVILFLGEDSVDTKVFRVVK
ncbi:MAG TPA: hypothetical protein VEB59_14205 [Gemmatimonadales bacterium]|nr:hypothetical protein [Gemmatimonadales bacterium]